MVYRWLAEVVVAVHVGYVLAVVLGMVLVLVGRAAGWEWVGNRWFRLIHLGMIAVVVVRAFIWANCPLTVWESDLRELAGQEDFEGSPVGWFLHALIHPELPGWVFPVVYALFGGLIVVA